EATAQLVRTMPDVNLSVQLTDLLVHLTQLLYQKKEGRSGKRGNEVVPLVLNQRDEHAQPCSTLTSDDAQLRQVAAQGVHQHCPLPDQKLADAMQHQHALLLLALCRNKAHRRSRDRLADCL